MKLFVFIGILHVQKFEFLKFRILEILNFHPCISHFRSDSLAKKSKPVVPERGRTPGKSPKKQSGSGLKRSCSFNVRARPVDTKPNHTRGLSGERVPRARTGSASSDRSDSKTAERSKPTVTMPTTPTLLK